MTTLGDIAANLGLPTFPCRADKTPLTLNGFKAASCDPPTIRRMFEQPDAALIAVPTGEVSGLVAIDVDIHRADADGRAWLADHQHLLPPTRTHTTQSGGRHLIFRAPADVEIRNSAGRIAPGVDVRGTGGYIIFPPSPGYEIADDLPPAEIPEWLVAACRKPVPIPPPPPRKTQTRLDGGTPYGLAALTDECDKIRSAPFGEQEKTLNAAALSIGRLVAGGAIDGSIAFAELLAAGLDMPSESGRNPWHPRLVEQKVQRGMDDGATQPRSAPEPEPNPEPKRYPFGVKPNGYQRNTNDESTEKPARENGKEHTSKSAEEPSSKSTEEPASENTEGPASESTEGPASENTEEPASENAEEPAGENAEEHQKTNEADDTAASAPLTIYVKDGTAHIMATLGEAAILQSGIPVFRRGPKLVRPTLDSVAAAHGRKTTAAGLKDLTPPGMMDLLLKAALWVKWNERKKEWRETNPPHEVGAIILSRYGEWMLPPVAGVITTPTLRPSGTILSEPGYDPETRLFYMHDPNLVMPAMPTHPTRADAETALNDLLALLKNFPFVNNASRSVALSGLITPVIRAAMDVAPLHAYRAPTAGTGKTYLVDTSSAIACGQICPVTSVGNQPEEFEKKLNGMLLAGYPIVSIDNVNGELTSDLLCQAVEHPLVRLRKLGASDQYDIECNSTIFINGNGLVIAGDLTRRTILALLDAGLECPELRVFDFDPVQTVLANRGHYVAACLTIPRAYKAADMPGRLPHLQSYGDWSDLVRSALVWLGQVDPVDSMESIRTENPETVELHELLAMWAAKFPDRGATAKEAIKLAEQRRLDNYGNEREHLEPDLREALLRIAGDRGVITARLLSRWISARESRIVAGMKFIKGTVAADGALRWKVTVP